MIFFLDFYDISMGLLWGFYWVPVWGFHDISLGFLWHFFETTMRFKQVFYGISMEIFGILDRIPVGLLWHPYRISIMFL